MRLLRLKSSRLNRVFLPSLDSLPARLLPNPRYYRWVIVGFGMLCSLLSSPGQSFVLSLHLGPLMRDAGLSRVGVSTLYAAATLAAAAVLPLLGTLADRLTARRYGASFSWAWASSRVCWDSRTAR